MTRGEMVKRLRSLANGCQCGHSSSAAYYRSGNHSYNYHTYIWVTNKNADYICGDGSSWAEAMAELERKMAEREAA